MLKYECRIPNEENGNNRITLHIPSNNQDNTNYKHINRDSINPLHGFVGGIY